MCFSASSSKGHLKRKTGANSFLPNILLYFFFFFYRRKYMFLIFINNILQPVLQCIRFPQANIKQTNRTEPQKEAYLALCLPPLGGGILLALETLTLATHQVIPELLPVPQLPASKCKAFLDLWKSSVVSPLFISEPPRLGKGAREGGVAGRSQALAGRRGH